MGLGETRFGTVTLGYFVCVRGLSNAEAAGVNDHVTQWVTTGEQLVSEETSLIMPKRMDLHTEDHKSRFKPSD